MKKSLIFSTYIHNNNVIWIGEKFIKLFREKYSDYTIFIGNNSPCDEWVSILDNIKDLNIIYANTDKNIEIDSDVSGFQTALKLLYESNLRYDLYTFLHTKSVTSKCYNFLDEVFDIFLTKNIEIEKFFENKNLGAYFPYYGKSDKEWINNCLNVLLPKTDYENTGFTSLYTFYTISGVVINWFLDNVINNFYNTKIIEFNFVYKNKIQNFDRYFFERDFPMIFEKLNLSLLYYKKCF